MPRKGGWPLTSQVPLSLSLSPEEHAHWADLWSSGQRLHVSPTTPALPFTEENEVQSGKGERLAIFICQTLTKYLIVTRYWEPRCPHNSRGNSHKPSICSGSCQGLQIQQDQESSEEPPTKQKQKQNKSKSSSLQRQLWKASWKR